MDSDTLPLSVSRETLQQSAALKTIRKKLVRKVLDVVKKLSDADRAVRNPEDGEGELHSVSAGYACHRQAVVMLLLWSSTQRPELIQPVLATLLTLCCQC